MDSELSLWRKPLPDFARGGRGHPKLWEWPSRFLLSFSDWRGQVKEKLTGWYYACPADCSPQSRPSEAAQRRSCARGSEESCHGRHVGCRTGSNCPSVDSFECRSGEAREPLEHAPAGASIQGLCRFGDRRLHLHVNPSRSRGWGQAERECSDGWWDVWGVQEGEVDPEWEEGIPRWDWGQLLGGRPLRKQRNGERFPEESRSPSWFASQSGEVGACYWKAVGDLSRFHHISDVVPEEDASFVGQPVCQLQRTRQEGDNCPGREDKVRLTLHLRFAAYLCNELAGKGQLEDYCYRCF